MPRDIPLNTERPLFADVNMRKAVNFAIDRTALAATAGPFAGSATDQYLPPGVPGFSDIDAYPIHPDIEQARELADWHPGDPLRPITVYYRSSGTVNLAQYQILKDSLEQIGFEVTGVGFPGATIYVRLGIGANRSTSPSASGRVRTTTTRGTSSCSWTARRSTTEGSTSTRRTSMTPCSTSGCTRRGN